MEGLNMTKGNNGKRNNDRIAKELEDALRKSLFSGVNKEQDELLDELFRGAVMLKNIYDSFTEAGFTEEQSLALVAEVLINGIQDQ